MGTTANRLKLEDLKNEQRRRRLIRFVKDSTPGYLVGWFHEELCEALEKFLQDVREKKSPRLMVTMPPRHGKSFICTERFPAWVLGKHPETEFIVTSYGSDQAEEFSKAARALCEDEYFKKVFPKFRFGASKRLKNWNSTEKGRYRATGVGGAITGSGADILVIDDPFKDWEDASSVRSRERVWNWYQTTAKTRLSPGGGTLIINTRWHDEDLSGKLMKSKFGSKWKIINYPAIAEKAEKHRKQGEALHPARYPIEFLKEVKEEQGPRLWACLYQQNPRVDGGMHIKRDWFNVIAPGDVPEGLQWRRAWDLAVKAKQHNDNSASVKGAIDKDGNFYISTGLNFKKEWPQTKRTIVQMAKVEKIGIGIENVSAFEIAVQEVRKNLKGVCMVQGVGVTTDKLTRALPWIDLAEQGKVFLVDGAWVPGFLDECEGFDPVKDSTPDNQIDAVSLVFKMLSRKKVPKVT